MEHPTAGPAVWNEPECRQPHLAGVCLVAHRSTQELDAGLRRCVETYNQDPKPFVWTKRADQILAALV